MRAAGPSPGGQPGHPKFAELERTAAAWPVEAATQRARRAASSSASPKPSPAPKKTKKRRKGKRTASVKELPKYDIRGWRIRPEGARKEQDPWKVDWEKFSEPGTPSKPPLPPAPTLLPPTPTSALPRSQSLPPRPGPRQSAQLSPPKKDLPPKRAASMIQLAPLGHIISQETGASPGSAVGSARTGASPGSAVGSARHSRPGSGMLGRSRPNSVSRPGSIASTLLPPAPRIHRPLSGFEKASRKLDAASELRALQEKIAYQLHAEEDGKKTKLRRNSAAGRDLSSDLKFLHPLHQAIEANSLLGSDDTKISAVSVDTSFVRAASKKSSISTGKSDEPRSPGTSPVKSARIESDVQMHSEQQQSSPAEHPDSQGLGSQPGTLSRRNSTAASDELEEFKKRLMDMFYRIQDLGEVHRHTLPVALGLAGFVACESLVNELYERLFEYNTMDQGEFVQFVIEYRDLENAKAMEAFKAFDCDGSGVIDRGELEELLEARGVYPLQHVIDELVVEACHGDPAKGLQPREFQRVLDILRENEGFARKEVKEFTELFNKCDYDGSGRLDAREIGRIVAILGYSADTKFEEALASVDVNGSGELNQKDFLVFLRKIREKDIELIRKFFRDNDTDGQPGLSRHELAPLLRSLHYLPDMMCIIETIKQMGITDFERDLNFSEVWRFLEIYRRQQGLRIAFIEEATKAFDEYSADGFKSPIDKMPAMLRMMGYNVAYHNHRKLAYLVDAEGTGIMNKQEFLRILGRLRQQELKEMWSIFQTGNDAEQEEVPAEVKELKELLSRAKEKGEKEGVETLDEFLPRAIIAQNIRRGQIKTNRGFPSAEAEEFKTVFSEITPDDDGRIRPADLRRLLEDLFPMLSDKSAMKGSRQKLQDILNSSAGGPVGVFEFLGLARYCQDLVEMDMLREEKEAIKKIGFDASEVDDFRSLFMGGTGQIGDQLITFSEIQELLGKVVPLGHRNVQALKEELLVATSTKQGRKSDDSADFPEFLALMRRLLDSNFAGIAKISEKKNGDKKSEKNS